MKPEIVIIGAGMAGAAAAFALVQAGTDGRRIVLFEGEAQAQPLPDAELAEGQKVAVGTYAFEVVHTPGHTPGSMCFSVEGTPLLFTGDTLFPGGPGATTFEHSDFATIIGSIEDRLFSPFGPDTIVLPGHGAGFLA